MFTKTFSPVASFTGAWIETEDVFVVAVAVGVASFTGAWIETQMPHLPLTTK